MDFVGLTSFNAVSTAANPPATTAAFAAFFATLLTFSPVIEAARFLGFAPRFDFVLPCFVALAREPLDDDFAELRLDRFFMISPQLPGDSRTA